MVLTLPIHDSPVLSWRGPVLAWRGFIDYSLFLNKENYHGIQSHHL
jgi:hypothetical protein